MNLLRSVAMAFLMFSRLPVPRVEWKKENMQYMLAMLPLVGCVEGAILLLWCWVSSELAFGSVLFAAGMTALPVFFTGGIHLDGFCDTVDALSSHASPERKREILKDPRAGAFAVIFVCTYLLVMFGLYTELPRERTAVFLACLIPVLGRTVSGFSGVVFPVSGETGMLAAFHQSARKRAAVLILAVWFGVCAVCILSLHVWAGAGMLVAAAVCCGYVYVLSRREFGGMSGDLAGYLRQIADLAMLAVLIVVWKVVTV